VSGAETRASRERATREAAGHLILSLAEELARPLTEIRELLAEVVATFDEHVAHAKGPVALSYDATKDIRELVADAYLKSASAARMARELATGVKSGGALETTSLNELIEAALVLVKYRFSAATELFIDLGTTPPVSIAPGDAAMGIARVLAFCAESTSSVDDAAVSIRTRVETRDRQEVVLSISENGRGGSDIELASVDALLEQLADRLGGQFVSTSEIGAGSTFELRLPVSS
jgi:signal transduction histidine kinase